VLWKMGFELDNNKHFHNLYSADDMNLIVIISINLLFEVQDMKVLKELF
jgi:hypothetical protein